MSDIGFWHTGSFKQGMLGKEERMANYAKQLPYNFSWIERARLAGTSIPSTVAQLEGLVREGVRTVFEMWQNIQH